jgi:hypothetical protein
VLGKSVAQGIPDGVMVQILTEQLKATELYQGDFDRKPGIAPIFRQGNGKSVKICTLIPTLFSPKISS